MEQARKAILLVDDNEDDELLTVDALRSSGVENEIFVARDGAEALDLMFDDSSPATRGLSSTLSLVLLDLKLPKVSGLEVLTKLRADVRTQYTPIVVLSSSNREEDIVTSYRHGANSYVRKAMDFAQYSEAMRCLSEYWLRYNEFVVAEMR